MINRRIWLLNFQMLIGISYPSNSGIWISKISIWKEDAAWPRALRLSNPDATVATFQPGFLSSFWATTLLNSSASANRTRKPMKIELDCVCSEDSLDSEIDCNGWSKLKPKNKSHAFSKALRVGRYLDLTSHQLPSIRRWGASSF
jgi:hypothetical protein